MELQKIWQRKIKCKAWVESKKARCSKWSVRGSRYCWHHQSWGITLVGALLSMILAPIVVNFATQKYFETRYKLSPSLRGLPLPIDGVMVCPKTVNPQRFVLRLKNDSAVALRDVSAVFKVASAASNIFHAPNWPLLPQDTSDITPPSELRPRLNVFHLSYPSIVTEGNDLAFFPFWVDTANVMEMTIFFEYSAGGVKSSKARLRLFFDESATNTSIVSGAAAREVIKGLGSTNFTDINVGPLHMRYQASNMIQRYGPVEQWLAGP